MFAAFIVPGVGARPTSNLGSTSATLNGHIDPLGGENHQLPLRIWHEHQLREQCAVRKGNSFSAPADVHADVSGLTTNVTYHFRLVASNAKGTSLGPDRTFSPSYVFGLSTEPVTNVTGTGATLNGSLTPKGEDLTILSVRHHFDLWQNDGDAPWSRRGIDEWRDSAPY